MDRAVASIDEEPRRLAAGGVTPREVTESKPYLIGSMPRTLETNSRIGAFPRGAEYFGRGLDYDVRPPRLIGGVTIDAVNALAARYLVPERAAVAVAGPDEERRGGDGALGGRREHAGRFRDAEGLLR